MKPTVMRVAIVAVLLTFLATGWGCRQAGTAHHSADAEGAPGPEESFEIIAETFRRGIEDIPVGFVVHEAGGHSALVGKNVVSSRLLPPAAEDEPYRAIITVDSESRYSIQRSAGDEVPDDTKKSDRGNNLLDEGAEQDGLEIYDTDLVSAPGASQNRRPSKSTEAPTPRVARQPDRVVREFELVYENDRWVLLTEPDPNTEQSIRNAFDRALATQI